MSKTRVIRRAFLYAEKAISCVERAKEYAILATLPGSDRDKCIALMDSHKEQAERWERLAEVYTLKAKNYKHKLG